MKAAGIPVSEIENKEDLNYVVPYHGKNLIEQELTPPTFNQYGHFIEKIFEVLKNAYIAGVSLDPHVKNFVFDQEEAITYVDIYPPYLEEYKEIILGNKSFRSNCR